MTSTRSAQPRQPPPASPGRLPVAALAAVGAVVLVVVALLLLLSRTGDEPAGPGTTASGTGASGPSGMAHVHGLGVDPGSGQLLAATHYGTFLVGDDGSAQRVGPVQDVMGFTVVGPDHYLASGHPGADQDGPDDLGLIESTDGGRTWTTLSLAGQADFHALTARHGRVYGHTRGRLMASDDAKTWDERAGLALADLAVSPDDPETLLATTEEGLAVSRDGGRTFDAVPSAPLLVLLAWTDGGTLVGVDPAGAVHASDDGGATWEQRGGVGGQPVAMTATDDAVFLATHDGEIAESTDGGSTFATRYREG